MAKNISLNFGSIKNYSDKIVKNLGWLFFALFLLILVFEVFEIQNSYTIVTDVNQEPKVLGVEKGIRINFDDYQKVVDRIQNAPKFVPSGGVTQNPFGVQVNLVQ